MTVQSQRLTDFYGPLGGKKEKFLWGKKRKISISCYKIGSLRLLTFPQVLTESHPRNSLYLSSGFSFPPFSHTPSLFYYALESLSVFKMALFHTMEYYSATKRNEVLIHTIQWMNLENMLRERSEEKRAHILQIHLQEMSRTGKSTDRK